MSVTCHRFRNMPKQVRLWAFCVLFQYSCHSISGRVSRFDFWLQKFERLKRKCNFVYFILLATLVILWCQAPRSTNNQISKISLIWIEISVEYNRNFNQDQFILIGMFGWVSFYCDITLQWSCSLYCDFCVLGNVSLVWYLHRSSGR